MTPTTVSSSSSSSSHAATPCNATNTDRQLQRRTMTTRRRISVSSRCSTSTGTGHSSRIAAAGATTGSGGCHVLLLAFLFAFTTYRSEAFASSHFSRFHGKRLLPFVLSQRRGGGGASATATTTGPQTSTASSTSSNVVLQKKSNLSDDDDELAEHASTSSSSGSSSSSSSVTPMKCVMQVPPTFKSKTSHSGPEDKPEGVKTTSVNGYNVNVNGNSNNNSNKKTVVTMNGASVNGAVVKQNNNYNGATINGNSFHLSNGSSSSSSSKMDLHLKRNGRNGKKEPSLFAMGQKYFQNSAAAAAVSSFSVRTAETVLQQEDEHFDPAAAEYVAETKLPTDIGQFQLRAYRVPGAPIGQEPCVIYSRDKPPFGADGAWNEHVPVRIHDQCLTSEVFRSQRCDCKEQLNMALKYIKENGGCIIYLQQEGRGIGLANKVAAYALQDVGYDTVDANLHLGFPEDARVYDVVRSILADMKIGSIRLMTNNPRKVERLGQLGICVESTVPMVVPKTNEYNRKYLETKQQRMSHSNLATLFEDDIDTNDNVAVPAASISTTTPPLVNGFMAPRKHLAEQYINNGTEFTANAVHVSLMLDTTATNAATTTTTTTTTTTKDKNGKMARTDELQEIEEDAEEAGVTAHEDGWCFGRQSVVDAIQAIARGEMVVVVDDMNRENEGDLIMAADQCTALDMAKIIRYSSGVVCVGMEGKRMDELKLPAMVTNNEDPKGTAFSVTVDATKEHGISTGISASDRATTVRLLASEQAVATDFHRPGHIFPLRARDGGVLTRDGHTEAAVDLARLAGSSPVGVLCEIVSEENPIEMMRLPELKRFCKQHGFVMTSIVDIAQYRRVTGL